VSKGSSPRPHDPTRYRSEWERIFPGSTPMPQVVSGIQLEHSRVILVNVHPESACAGRPCTLHNRTNHSMRSFPQHWRDDRHMMERTCPHGIGHPDPDELSSVDTTHGCDGCCDPARGETGEET